MKLKSIKKILEITVSYRLHLFCYCEDIFSKFNSFNLFYIESTPEGRKVATLDKILLNGNNITMVSYLSWFCHSTILCVSFCIQLECRYIY